MLDSNHKKFLGNWFNPDQHYSFDEAPHQYVFHSKNIPDHVFSQIMDSFDEKLIGLAATHKGATPEQLHKLLDYPNQHIRSDAAKNSNASKENIIKALNDRNMFVSFAAKDAKNYKKYFPE